MTIRAGIIGGAGYTGGELLRILLHHPHVNIRFVHSRSNAGRDVSMIHQDLEGETEIQFTDAINDDVDVLFLCLGHGESKKFLSENKIKDEVRVIDLANDFRLKKDSKFGKRTFVYGLPEMYKQEIAGARNIANPGCFATAIQLGLLPLAKEGLLREVYTTGITGSTGAGQSLTQTSHFSWRANNIQAYKTLTHQHLGEIGESLTHLQPNGEIDLSFIPWRGDFTRGIFVSSQVNFDLSEEEARVLYKKFYHGQPFVNLSKQPIYLKQVLNTNKALIQLEKVGSKLVIHSSIDNLLKGASGQAVQNMNLMFGIDETTGLKLKGAGF